MLGFAAFWHRLLPAFCHARDLTRLACSSRDLRRTLKGARIDISSSFRELYFERIWNNWSIIALRYDGPLFSCSEEHRAQVTHVNLGNMWDSPDVTVRLLQACPNVTVLSGPFTKRMFQAISLHDFHMRLRELEFYTHQEETVDLSQYNKLQRLTLRFDSGRYPAVRWPADQQIQTLVLINHARLVVTDSLKRSWIAGLSNVHTLKTFGYVTLSSCFLEHLAPGLETMQLAQAVNVNHCVFPRIKALNLIDGFGQTAATFPCLEDLTIDFDWNVLSHCKASLPNDGNLRKLRLDFREFEGIPLVRTWVARQTNLLVLELTMGARQFPAICSPTLRSFKFSFSARRPGLRTLWLGGLCTPALQDLVVHNSRKANPVALKIAGHQSLRHRFPKLQRLEVQNVRPHKRILASAQIQVITMPRATRWGDLY